MKGTLLTQLAHEYELIDEKIAQAQRFAEGGKETLADLQHKRKVANERYAQAERAREMERENDVLGGELAWAHVAGKQAELNEVNQKLSKAQAHLRALDQKLEDLRVRAILVVLEIMLKSGTRYNTVTRKLPYAPLRPIFPTRMSEPIWRRKRRS